MSVDLHVFLCSWCRSGGDRVAVAEAPCHPTSTCFCLFFPPASVCIERHGSDEQDKQTQVFV